MMIGTLRSSITILVLLAFCQSTFGGVARQTISRRYNPNDEYVRSTILLPDVFLVYVGQTVDLNVFANDQLSGLDWNSFQITVLPEHGTIIRSSIDYDGYVVYQVDSEGYYGGWDSFTYSFCRDDNTCYSTQVKIYSPLLNQAPTAVHDIAIAEDKRISIDVLSNDFDVDGPFANYGSLKIIEQPQYGSAHVDSVTHEIVYYPYFSSDFRFVGLDTLTYQICDRYSDKLCSFATVGITVVDVCPACEACNNYEAAFDDQLASIKTAFYSL